MPNQTLINLLQQRSQLTIEQISELSDQEAWQLIRELENIETLYVSDKFKDQTINPEKRNFNVYFSGFSLPQRKFLEAEAVKNGFSIRRSACKKLNAIIHSGDDTAEDVLKSISFGAKAISISDYSIDALIQLQNTRGEAYKEQLESTNTSETETPPISRPDRLPSTYKHNGLIQIYISIILMATGVFLPGLLIISIPILISGCEAALNKSIRLGYQPSSHPSVFKIFFVGILCGFVGILIKPFILISALLIFASYTKRCPGLFTNNSLPN
jgi:DNA-binding NarL/FixJ family response regulator